MKLYSPDTDRSATPPPEPAQIRALRDHLRRSRVALVHDWLVNMRGGEWVLAALLKLFPTPSIHTLFYDPGAIASPINVEAIHPSVLNRLPGVRRYYRWLLPVLPAVIERMKFKSNIDLVLTTSHCVAHGVHAPAGARHVNYYFSPMRYLYDQQTIYRSGGGLAGRALAWAAPRLTRWDRAAARRADAAWAISNFVAQRIEEAYGLTARVIYPPVRTDVFLPPSRSSRSG